MKLDLKLKEIGLTDGEVKVYLALLKLKEATKTPISTEANVSPSKVYDILERLTKKGLVSHIKKRNIKYFKVANPTRLKDFIIDKENEINQKKQVIDLILPELLTTFSKIKDENDAEIFNGWKGLDTVYNNIINDLGKDDLDYAIGGGVNKTKHDRYVRFFNNFNKKRFNKKIKMNIILGENYRGKSSYFNSKFDNVRYLDNLSPVEINIFGNKVSILLLLDEPFVILIDSKIISSYFLEYFDKFWKLAKK